MPDFTVVVTGWRNAQPGPHRHIIATPLDELRATWGTSVLLRHGQCKYGGVDLIADRIARGLGWEVVPYPAEERDGRILGPARNRRMLRDGADLVLAFPGPGSKGTWDCIQQAAELHIPFRGVGLEGPPATRPSVHECPGACGRKVPPHLFACSDCWARLPGHHRQDVLRGYRARRTDPPVLEAAMVAAINWFRQHPPKDTRHG